MEKAGDRVRLCGDYKILNLHLLVNDHPLPTIEELFATVTVGEIHSICLISLKLGSATLSDDNIR